MRRFAIARLAAAALLFGLMLSGSAFAQESHVVEVVELEGVIDPATAAYLESKLGAAADDGSEALVLQINTPGGLDISMREMVQSILRSPVPVIVWVGPPGARAASAGVFLLYASHVATMAPGTNLGAAHPVDLGGDLADDRETKAVEDAAALLRELATTRDRSVEFAEAAVRQRQALGAEEAFEEDVIDLPPETTPTIDRLLGSLQGMQVETATGTQTLATSGPDVTIRFHQPGLLTRILHAITDPTIAYLLLILGFWAIVFELSQPGIGVAGVAGLIALVMSFTALAVLPFNVAGLLLVILGLIFFTIDVFTAGFGVWTAGGTLGLLFGSIMLFGGVSPAIEVSPWVIGIVVAASFLFFGFAMTVAMRARKKAVLTGSEGMIGLSGEARSDLAPEGQAWVKGAIWKARALNGPISSGSRVRVKRVDGLLLIVQEEQREPEKEGD